MRKLVRRLALLLALLLTLTGLSAGAMAEDWRDLLSGLLETMTEEDYDAADVDAAPTRAPEQTKAPKKTKAPKSTKAPKGTQAPRATEVPGEPQFQLPVTDPQQIVNYLEYYGELPENFITKNEAKDLGWGSTYYYVGDIAPGMCIGGDRFGNYEGQLPSAKGRKWYECDANYGGRKRGAERVLFSSDGLYYYTDDHYNTFTQLFPEDLK